MTDPKTEFDNDQSSSRREFVKAIGGGALGAALLAGGQPLLAGDPFDDAAADDAGVEEAGGCSFLLKSTDRNASLVPGTPINVTQCDPCDCITPTQFHQNFLTRMVFTTDFLANLPCDEIARLQIPEPFKLRWTLLNRFVRMNGPCGIIGAFDGSIRWTDGAGILLANLSVRGTLGYDTNFPPGPAPRCCAYPRVVGAIFGNGLAPGPLAGCVVRWTFFGIEGTTVCQPTLWQVGVAGIVRCPCV